MKIIIIEAETESVNYSLVDTHGGFECGGVIKDFKNGSGAKGFMGAIKARFDKEKRDVDAIAICCPYGGKIFKAPVFYDDAVGNALTGVIPYSPLLIPTVISAAKSSLSLFHGTPVIILFETSFFYRYQPKDTNSPVDADMAKKSGLCRSGHHGLLHELACRYAQKNGKNNRIISICLEPGSEIVAAMGDNPIMTAGGSSNPEALSGDTNSNGVLSFMKQKLEWDPEKINFIIPEESGLSGLLGSKVTLHEVIFSEKNENKMAANLFYNQVLKACDSAITALGGVDCFVFSGRYAECGDRIKPYLENGLKLKHGKKEKSNIEWKKLELTNEEVAAKICERVMKKKMAKTIAQ
jgi:acetate kinase